jgi:hypothetical protein
VHVDLTARTEAKIGVHLRPGFPLETVPIFLGESGLEEFEPELPLLVFELPQCG